MGRIVRGKEAREAYSASQTDPGPLNIRLPAYRAEGNDNRYPYTADSHSGFPWTFPSAFHSEGPPDHVLPLRQGAQRCGVSLPGDLRPLGPGPAVLSPRPGSPYPGEVIQGTDCPPEPAV